MSSGAPGPLGQRFQVLLEEAPEALALDTPEGPLTRAGLSGLVRELVPMLTQEAWGGSPIRPWLGWNRPEMIAALLACEACGLVFMPLNWRLADAELLAQMRHAGAKRVLGDVGFEARAATLNASLRSDSTADDALPRLRGGDLMLVYTSGTTGLPKGAVHTALGMAANVDAAVAVQSLTPVDRVLSVLPLFHVGGLCIQTLPALLTGAAVRLHPRFEPSAWFADLAAWRPSTCLLVPATLRALLEHPDWAQADLSCLRFINSGSSIVPVALIERFHSRGVPVAQVYGSTETGPVSIALRPDEALAHPGKVGRPAPGVAIGLVSPDTGREVEPGAVGEVWVHGANVMRGYLFPTDAEDHVDGWFRSGDLGRVDENGLYEIVGRSKDMIISGGENIYPAEIENLVLSFEGVADCAVVGVPDARWGEVPVLAVVARSGRSLEPAALGAQLEGRLARYKQPRRVVVMSELPRTALGKVIKPALAAQLATG